LQLELVLHIVLAPVFKRRHAEHAYDIDDIANINLLYPVVLPTKSKAIFT